jgi:hypothetical protein
MDELHWVDELYRAFCQTLPGMLHAEACNLAYTLGLAPSGNVPWSSVFNHDITLAAPALIAEAMPGVRGPEVQDALLAHLLAVIGAFGTDRLQDEQVRPTWQLETLLAHVRRARDEAIRRVMLGAEDPAVDFAAADEETALAIKTERRLLLRREPATFEQYRSISLAKQRVGLPASIALARAAGWERRRVEVLARMLSSVCVALQLYDDVMDWEEDHGRGGAWAVALAHGLRGASPGETAPLIAPAAPRLAPLTASAAPRPAPPSHVRRFVLESGVLASMLAGSRVCFRQSRRRAAALGARRVAAWAQGREAHVAELQRCEAESPGYANRARALSAWAKVVLG